jgi:general secretion pathway protein B
MSFILDALKKSEAERLRKNTPGIANIAESGRQKSSAKWMWLVLALLAINLIAVAGLIFNARTEPAMIQVPATAEQPEAGKAPAIAAAIEREPALVVRDEPDVTVTTPTTEQIAPVAATVSTGQSGPVYSGLDSFDELRATGKLALPDLHLDIHVYGGQSADRFVFVNMSKYKEGATLSEGPSVREITPDGVVLFYQGTAFLLPRE